MNLFRDMGCVDCRRVTSGDCGKHGPTLFTTDSQVFPLVTVASGGYVPSPEQQEIAHLRQQVESLTAALAADREKTQELTIQRDDARVNCQSAFQRENVLKNQLAEARAALQVSRQERDKG